MQVLLSWRRLATASLRFVATCTFAMLPAALPLPAHAAPFVYITNQDDDTVSVIDIATNTVTATVPVGDTPYAAVATLDNTRVYVANFYGNSISVIDAYTNTVVATLANICTNPTNVSVMPGGTQIWVACLNSGQAKRIDIATNTVVGTVSGLSRPTSIAFNTAGTTAYIACSNGSSVRVINTATGMQTNSLSVGAGTVDVAVTPDGKHVYSTSNTDKKVWDSILAPTPDFNWFSLPSPPVNLVLSPDGSTIYTTVNAGAVWRIKPSGLGAAMDSVGAGSGSNGIDITGDGARLYVTNPYEDTVSVIDTATFTRIATIPVGNYPSTWGRFVAKGAPPATALPGPPTGVNATAGIAQVSVAFAAPANTGGGVIQQYTATCGTHSASGPASPIVVTGLTNGVAVTCTVIATNSAGNSVPSAPSNSVTPSAVLPGAPTGVAIATAGSRQVNVSFTPPAFDGGAAINSYKVTCGNVTQTGAASPILVGSLTNGIAVACTVVATNEIGDGPASALSNSVVPGAAPDAPASVVATRGDRQLTVSFVPGDDNGFAVSNYRVACGARSVNGTASPLTVTSLPNGVAVTCTVTATNARGTSTPSAASAPVAPATSPNAPAIGVATRGNAQASVTFTPGDDGGAPITGYRATCGVRDGSGTASPIVVTGLTNGTAVTCRVRALNAIGEGALSAASNSVTPATVPDAPRTPSVKADGTNLTIDFQAPLSDGGAPVTGYRATCGTHGVSGTFSPLALAGLPVGVPVSCSVVATNIVGDSNPATSNTVTPITVPGIPTGVTAVRGNERVTVSFVPPTSTGGSAITNYLAVCDAASGEGTASPVVVPGLVNGVPVTCFVIAFNAAGTGKASESSNSVTPAGVPDAPALTTATSGDGSASLAFTVPNNNGAAITGYSASCTPGTHTATGAASPLTVPGLVNGTAYQCAVRATNDVGTSASSNALTVTPRILADLSISNSNSATFLAGGGTTSYLVEAINHGNATVTGARVRDALATPLSNATWVCSGQGGGVCPAASGSGNIDALINLPAGASVAFLLSASVAKLPETPATNTATITAPGTVNDPNSANDSATDGPDTVGIFRSGFEATP